MPNHVMLLLEKFAYAYSCSIAKGKICCHKLIVEMCIANFMSTYLHFCNNLVVIDDRFSPSLGDFFHKFDCFCVSFFYIYLQVCMFICKFACLFTGVTQEEIDDKRLEMEKHMLADLKKIAAEKGNLEYRDKNWATPVCTFDLLRINTHFLPPDSAG